MNTNITKGPNPDDVFPIVNSKGLCYIKNIVKNPNIIIGEYTYYFNPSNPEDFENNVLYLYDYLGDKLIIGKFCAIAAGVKFIMNGANHKLNAFSTYPFTLFGKGWGEGLSNIQNLPVKGDTIIGNDVWIGFESMVMPGVKIGDGAIIGSKSLVTKDVPPYTIVGGNPAKIIRTRFDDETIELLLKIKWWDWSIEKITENIDVLHSEDIEKLRLLI